MISITIMSIVVVAVLTAIIFGLAWIGFSACLKAYKAEVSQGKHDADIYKKFFSHPTHKGVIVKVLGYTMTFVLLLALIALLAVGIVYNERGENLAINGYTPLVIKSGSMSGFYSSTLEREYQELGYSKDLQFSIGDICIFEAANQEQLVLGEVYGYKYKDIIITHRLIGHHHIKDDTGNIIATYYIFRGDNNATKDQVLVSADKILYHYTGKRIPALGAFILYAQSYFGIWSLLCLVGIVISFDVVIRKINKISQERADFIGGYYEK